jgi:putative peptide zinc metalloprotease protein
MTIGGRRASRRAPRPAPIWDEVERALVATEERPRLAGGAESAHQRTRAGVAYVVIHNPANHAYLKLDEEEFELLVMMDGEHTVKELVIEYYLRHEVLALPRIAGLVRLLKLHGFLAGGYVDAYAELTSRLHSRSATDLVQRLWRGLLQTSIPIPGLDRFFDWLYRAGGWVFFTRPAGVAGLLLLILGPVFFLLELSSGRYPLFRFGGSYLQGFGLLLLLDVVTISVHEAGHALAMKYAGRFVRQSGVMLYYGMPAAYVDTTDAWMAPRRMRLLVSFAGPWTGVWLGGITAPLAFFLPSSRLGAFLFSWAFVALVDNLFNFCPLLELDGYFLLVDLLEKPMLRARSFAFLREQLWRRLRDRERLTSEERFFVFFGIASVAWSVMELYLALRIYEVRGARIIAEVWDGGNLYARSALVVVLTVIAVPILLALRSLLLWILREIRVETRWLRGRATRLAHREAITTLLRVRFAEGLPEERILEVARHLRPRWVEAGEAVYRAGDQPDDFFLIDSGAFEVHLDGHPRQRLGPGDHFGEQALLHAGPREADVIAAESGRLFAVDRSAFHATLERDVEVWDRFQANLAYRQELARIPLFRHLTAAERDLLLESFEPMVAAPGKVIVREGERGDRFYVIRSGSATVLKSGSKVAELGPGDAFGEMALLLDVPRTATVRAIGRTELLALGKDQFHDLLLRYCRRQGALERLSHLRMVAHKRSNHEVQRQA